MKRSLFLRALALGMGVAGAVISVISNSDSNVGFMLGLGLACLAIDALDRK